MEKERKGEGNASKFRKALQFLRGQSKVSFPRPIRGTLQLMQPWIKAHAPSNTADSLLVAQQLPEPEAGKKFLFSFFWLPVSCHWLPSAEFNQNPVSKGVQKIIWKLPILEGVEEKIKRRVYGWETRGKEPTPPRTDYSRKDGKTILIHLPHKPLCSLTSLTAFGIDLRFANGSVLWIAQDLLTSTQTCFSLLGHSGLIDEGCKLNSKICETSQVNLMYNTLEARAMAGSGCHGVRWTQ